MATRKSKPDAESDDKRERGRPRLFETPEAFEAKAREYFETDGMDKPSLSGIAYFMGFSDRESFAEYERFGPDYSRTVKRARLKIEQDRQNRLIDRKDFTPGIIFDLKNNHGWKDKQEVEFTGNIAGLLAERRKRAK